MEIKMFRIYFTGDNQEFIHNKLRTKNKYTHQTLVGCFGFNGPLRQYFSLYWAASQREGEREEKGYMRVKKSEQPLPAPTASAVGPCPTVIKVVGRPGTGSLPSTFAPPDHPHTHQTKLGPGRCNVHKCKKTENCKAGWIDG